jgi:hypothetical protein
MSCSKNYNAQNLSDDERKYLSGFYQRALSAFGLSESKAIQTSTSAK